MTAVSRDRLIAASGIDGSGKTTFVRALAEGLRARGESVVVVSALKPTGPSPVSWVRELRIAGEADGQRQRWIAGYFALVFCDNVQRVVEPALRSGQWVIADRWSIDHVANQEAFGVDMREWSPLLDRAGVPGRHLLLDVPVEVAARRLVARGDEGVGRGDAFLRKARNRMRELAGTGVQIVDGVAPTASLVAAALGTTVAAASGGM